ncbi:MAG: hypothetical protein EAZ57_05300 [Cytophagales bacterium]|nr:MAG: hypothetical protein EAZ67_06280 [Cytophagales bacterium]TAF60966.1 MAG: hypothetical protein EAZ57_05300 [Cytophagales bacterium]
MTTKRFLYSILFLLCSFTFVIHSAQAQDDADDAGWIEDPLKKPAIWEKLLDNPTDSELWESYVGQEMKGMSPKERERLNLWKQELMLRHILDNENVIGIKVNDKATDGVFIDETAFKEFQQKLKDAPKGESITVAEIAGIEAIIMSEQSDLKELRTNVAQNFVILEDVYFDAFEQLGVKYLYYKDKYPKGEITQMKWVEQHDEELKKLKKNEFDKLRAQMKGSNK